MSGYVHFPDEVVISPIEGNTDPQNTFCQSMYRHWKDLGPEISFSSIDLLQCPEILPLVVILDHEIEIQDFRFRFVGQRIVQITGRDLTGKRVLTPDSVASLTKRFCEESLTNAVPLISRSAVTVTQDGLHYQFEEAIALPVVDGDKNLSRIVLVHGLSG